MILSPGDWHKKVPRDLAANLKYRRWLYAAGARDKRLAAGFRAMCRDDVLFFVNSFAWAYDPRKPVAQRVLPFVTYDFQEEALVKRPGGMLWAIEEREDLLVEKSRDMGATYLCLWLQDWLARFHEYTQTLNISRSEAAVDDESPNSLFWKLRWCHEHTPRWLSGEIVEQKLFFGYTASKSTVTGEASTAKAGVGGRAGLVFVDEFPEIREAKAVREKTASTADVRFFNGTHKGSETEFFKMSRTPEIRKLVFHWSMHPDKRRGLYRMDPERPTLPLLLDPSFEYPPDYKFVLDGTPTGGPFPGLRSPWYDKKCRQIKNPRAIAQDLDIDPVGSASQFFETLEIATVRAEVCRDPAWEGDVRFDPATGQGRLVRRPDGLVKVWVHVQPDGRPVIQPAERFGAGADCSLGRTETNSCFSVFSALTGEKALEYADPSIKPEDFAGAAVALCRLFGDALLAWETPGPGLTFGDRVIELGYGNVYLRAPEHDLDRERKRSTTPGWVNNNNACMALLLAYKEAIETRQCLNRSDIALEETLAYETTGQGYPVHAANKATVTGNDPSGARINHGDRVIADALAWFMCVRLGTRRKAEKPQEPAGIPYGSMAWRRAQDKLRTSRALSRGWR